MPLFVFGIFIKKYSFKLDKLIFLAFSLGFLVAGALTYWSPYPYLPDVDIFRHTIFINQILAGEFVYASAYLPSFHTLFAVLVKTFFVETFDLLWAFRFLALPLYSIGIYLFVNKISQNNKIALLASFLAPLITIEYASLLNTAPKVLSYIILPYFLYLTWDIKSKKIITLVIIIATSLLIHWPMGLANLAVILSLLFFKYLYQKNTKIISRVILVIILISLAFLLLQEFRILNLNQISFSIFGELDLNKYNFNSHFENLLDYFSIIILGLAGLGILFHRIKSVICFLPGLFLIICVYFLPLNASHRLLISSIPLIILFLSLAILEVYKVIDNKFLKYLFIIFILILLPISAAKQYYLEIKEITAIENNEGNYTLITPNEFEVAEWLKNNTSPDTLIITDTVNSLFFSAYAHRQSFLPAEDIMQEVMTRKKAASVYSFLKSQEQLQNKKILIYLDGRTSFWVKNQDDKEIFYAPNQEKKFTTFKDLDKFFDSEYFSVVHQQKDKFYFIELK